MTKGNLHSMDGVWTMRAINEGWTLLELDLRAVPNVIIPDAWIEEGNRDAAADAVNAVHDRAQGNSKWVPWNGAAAQASAH
jgi:hypothetical protein